MTGTDAGRKMIAYLTRFSGHVDRARSSGRGGIPVFLVVKYGPSTGIEQRTSWYTDIPKRDHRREAGARADPPSGRTVRTENAITLRQLLFFHQIVRHEFNVTAAAEALYTAQSGVSKQLQALADELGVELFQREGKRLVGLTEAGQRIHTLAERMLADAEAIREIGRRARKDYKSRLHVVATRHAASTRVRIAALEFQRQQPKVVLHISEEDPEAACRMTLSGEAQLGVVPESHAIDKQLRAIPLERWRLAVVAPVGHWLLAEPEITLEMLAECPVGCYERGAASRQQVDAAFEQAGLMSPVVFELISSDKILEYVESGACVGIVAESALEPERRHPAPARGRAPVPADDHLDHRSPQRDAESAGE